MSIQQSLRQHIAQQGNRLVEIRRKPDGSLHALVAGWKDGVGTPTLERINTRVHTIEGEKIVEMD